MIYEVIHISIVKANSMEEAAYRARTGGMVQESKIVVMEVPANKERKTVPSAEQITASNPDYDFSADAIERRFNCGSWNWRDTAYVVAMLKALERPAHILREAWAPARPLGRNKQRQNAARAIHAQKPD